MTTYQVNNNLPNFVVKPAEEPRAPYGSIHNLSSLCNVTSYAGSMLPVNLLSAGTLLVVPTSDISIELPVDLVFYRFLGGNKYISDGDIQVVEVINRGNGSATFTHGIDSQGVEAGSCECIVIQWTTRDIDGNLLPDEEIYYNILSSCLPVLPQPITIGPYYEVSPPYLGTYNWAYDITWPAPFTNATSYEYSSTCPDPFVFEQTGTDMVRLHFQWLTYAEFLITVTGLNACSSGSSTGSAYLPCFLAGSKVRMADGSDKNIEDVCIGDQVVGAFGEINTVWALHRPLLGSAKMMCINDEHHTSSHHPHIGSNKTFYSHDPSAISTRTYGLSHPVITEKGNTMWKLHGVPQEWIQPLTIGVELQSVSGPKQVVSLTIYDLDPRTQLYNLVMGGSHTFTVDGYAVTGWPRTDDFDYINWSTL